MNPASQEGLSSAALSSSLPVCNAVEVQGLYTGPDNSIWARLRGDQQSMNSCVNNIGAPPPRPSGSFGYNINYDLASLFDGPQFNDPMLGQFSPPSSQTTHFSSSQPGTAADGTVNAIQVYTRSDEQAPVGMSLSFLDHLPPSSEFDLLNFSEFPFSQGSTASAPATGTQQDFFVKLNSASGSGSGMASVQASDSQESTADGGDTAGQYGFSISFPKEANGKEWVFNEDNKKLYAKTDNQWDVQFNFTKAPPTEFTIRAHPEFQDKGNYGNTVRPCIKHKDVVRLYKQFLYTKETGAKHDNDCVILTFPGKSSDKKYTVKGRYQCTCHNSCYKAKSAILVVFEFCIKNKVLGRKSLEIRSCACPRRDSDADSKKDREPGRKKGRKRKANEMNPEENKSPGMVIKEEENCSNNGVDANVFMTDGQPRPAKTLKQNCMDQKLEVDEDSVYLDFSVRLPRQFQNIVDGQLKSLQSVVEMMKAVFPFAGAKVPLETLFNPGSGLRPAAVAVPTKVPSRENVGEIHGWLKTVVKHPQITYQVFVHEGSKIETLDDIFNLTQAQLADHLSAFREEVVEMVWQHIQSKERPPGPFTSGSQPVTQSYSFSQS